jgi:hypothetical protein
MDAGLEYLRNDRWLYTHPGLFTTYLSQGELLGHPLGGDVEQVVGWGRYQVGRVVRVQGAVVWRRQGETVVATTPWRVEKDRVFPSGVVERLWGGRIGVTYLPVNDGVGRLELGYDARRNAGHRPGVGQRTFSVFFSVSYKLDLPL